RRPGDRAPASMRRADRHVPRATSKSRRGRARIPSATPPGERADGQTTLWASIRKRGRRELDPGRRGILRAKIKTDGGRTQTAGEEPSTNRATLRSHRERSQSNDAT